jgi:hypothetical protein
MSHPVLQAIRTGAAPKTAKIAAAKGLLPLPPEVLLETLALLTRDLDPEIQSAAISSIGSLDPAVLLPIARNEGTAPELLAFMCVAPGMPEAVAEATLFNRATPDNAATQLAFSTGSPTLIEALTVNQQRLIRNPQLIEAILHNPRRTPEAERRAREVKTEFLEKEFGRRQVSGEVAAQSRAEVKSVADLIPEMFDDAPVAPPPISAPPPQPPPAAVEPPASVAPPPPPAPGPRPATSSAAGFQPSGKISSVGPIAMIQQGKAPRPAKLMVAQGKLPLGPEDMLFAQVLLTADDDDEIAFAARTSIDQLDPEKLLPIVQSKETPEEVLHYLLLWDRLTSQMGETILVNPSTPDSAVLAFAKNARDGSLLEAVTINQQRLIRLPDIIEAVLNNPASTFEAVRRAREVKTEFFEKELGAEQVARERQARAAKFAGILDAPPISDEAFEAEFQSLLAAFESEVGQTFSDEAPDAETADAAFEAMLATVKSEEGIDLLAEAQKDGESSQRLSIYQLLARMSVKERIFAAIKGGREARAILIRDANRMVCTAVVKNPRISEAEVESIANIKGISEDVLRIIAMNRSWISNYTIMHNLVRNARCPLNFSMQYINRLQNRDLMNLGKSKAVPDALRQAANRLITKRRESGSG